MDKIVLLAASLSLWACTNSSNTNLAEIIKSADRSPKNVARDVYRHPRETLEFFEVEPDMTVVEISPGGGWYTEILAPYLVDGALYLAIFSEDSDRSYAARLNKQIKEKLATQKGRSAQIYFTVLDSPKEIGPVAPKGSADRVLTFRNVHNWMKDGTEREVFRAFYDALKPGGILGVVEHRAKTDKKQDPKAASGYVREDFVIDLAESVGFQLVAKSEINANPKDDANHPEGVWTLPPSLRLKDVDEEKYRAIGESDRMTLKFKKP